MSEASEYFYHLGREKAEREAAAKATFPEARDAHTALADRHADKAWSVQEGYEAEIGPMLN